jgi:phage shock protein A
MTYEKKIELFEKEYQKVQEREKKVDIEISILELELKHLEAKKWALRASQEKIYD